MPTIRRMSSFLRPGSRAAGTLTLVLALLAGCCAAGELTVQAAPLGHPPPTLTAPTTLLPTPHDVFAQQSPRPRARRPRARSSAAAKHPSRATIIEAQRLFYELGYPLGTAAPGGLGVRTRGALSYFQRKYGLPITGHPDARTIAKMRAVAVSLRGRSAVAQAPPRDLVERILGDGVPIFAIGIALAIVLALLALSTQRDSAQDSAATEDTIVVTSEES